MKEKDYEALTKIGEFEATAPIANWPLGWSWQQVGVFSGIINNLVVNGLAVVTYQSNKHTNYRLTDKAKELLAKPSGTEEQVVPVEALFKKVSIEALFSDIIGHDDIKVLLKECLAAEKPIHILLYGPPSLAKTLFLWDVERYAGQQAAWILGSSTSKSGLLDLLSNRKPRILLIDELEKMNRPDMASLLSVMEGGRIVRAKVGRGLDSQLDVWVIAAANFVGKLPRELLSRFAKKELHAYSTKEFQEVVLGILMRREGLDEQSATQVATALIGRTNDIRDAIRIARLSKTLGVAKAVELLL